MFPQILLLTCLTTVISVDTNALTNNQSMRMEVPSTRLVFNRVKFPLSICGQISDKVNVIEIERSIIRVLCIKPSVEDIFIDYCNISEITIASHHPNKSFKTTQIMVANSPITSLPNNISALTKLSSINIYKANLQGVNLSVFNNMNNLAQLLMVNCNISEANVDGPLELPLLDTISLQENSLKQIDMRQWNMPRLEYLCLSHNHLSEVPPLNRFPNLTEAMLSYNFIKIVNMNQVSGLEHLVRLDLADNRILRLDALEPIQLPALSSIELGRNFLQYLNLSFWNIPNLASLYLQDNLLYGIHGSESVADNLVEIYLSGSVWGCHWLINVTIELKANWRDDCHHDWAN